VTAFLPVLFGAMLTASTLLSCTLPLIVLQRVNMLSSLFFPVRQFFCLCLPSSLLLLLLPCLTSAQSGGGTDILGTGGRHTIQGRVYLPSGGQVESGVKVRLESASAGTLSVLTDVNGAFIFRSLIPGSYTIVVEAGNDYEPMRESVFIDENRSGQVRSTSGTTPRIFTVPIYLRLKRGTATVGKPEVVNAELASAPKAAQEHYAKALELSRGGNSKEAIEQLKKALVIHPDFALALNELGVQHMKIGQPDKAVEVLKAALKISPEAFTPRLNFGIALFQKKEYTAAQTALQEALQRNESSPGAHLYLGLTLISLQHHEAAEKELQRAISIGGKDMSLAHYYLGGIYWAQRQYQRAADELETYLNMVPQNPDAERLRITIKDLRNKK
jgi:tetratricopeptide (TPR) repeat protein